MKIYFWNYKKLASDLREGLVSQKQYYIYWALWIVIEALLIRDVIEKPITSAINFIIWLAIPYIINKRGDGKDYIKRLICLDMPIILRFTVIVLVGEFITQFVFHIPGTGRSESLSLGLDVFYTVVYMAMYIHAMCIASGQSHR